LTGKTKGAVWTAPLAVTLRDQFKSPSCELV
jgi:hypothetical protein